MCKVPHERRVLHCIAMSLCACSFSDRWVWWPCLASVVLTIFPSLNTSSSNVSKRLQMDAVGWELGLLSVRSRCGVLLEWIHMLPVGDRVQGQLHRLELPNHLRACGVLSPPRSSVVTHVVAHALCSIRTNYAYVSSLPVHHTNCEVFTRTRAYDSSHS